MNYARTPYRVYPRLPAYRDPDESRAENLAKAAWYLYQAGMDAEAEKLTDMIAEIARDVKPGKNGVKHLGQAAYYPAGIIRVQGTNIEIPAPGFDYMVPSGEKDIRKAFLGICRDELGWFPSRQLAAKLDGLGAPQVSAGSKPARRLRMVQDLCKDFGPGMPREMAKVLYRKLDKLLRNNPSSTETTSNNFIIRYDNNAKRYVYRMYYLTDDQVTTLLPHIDLENSQFNEHSLRKAIVAEVQAQAPCIKWHGISKNHPCKTDTPSLKRAMRETVPEAFPDDIRGDSYVWRRSYIDDAVSAACDTANLMLANIALMQHSDIKDVLAKTGMMDPGLKILPDLHKKAASIAFMANMPESISDNAAVQALDVFLKYVKDLD